MVVMEFVETVRLDKWLWAARFFKSRTLAVSAIDVGRVHVNGDRAKPARLIKVGDKLLVQREQDRVELTVKGITEQRKSAPLARLLYEETQQSIDLRVQMAESRRLFAEPSRGIYGRPTKRDRRSLDRFRSE